MAAPAAAATQVHAATAEQPAAAKDDILVKTTGAEQQGAQQIQGRAGGQAGGEMHEQQAPLVGGQEATIAAQAALLGAAQKVTDCHDLAICGRT